MTGLEGVRSRLERVYALLVEAFDTDRSDLETILVAATAEVRDIGPEVFRLSDGPAPDVVNRLMSVAVLLDHLGAADSAAGLLSDCGRARNWDVAARSRATFVESMLLARRGVAQQARLLDEMFLTTAPEQVTAIAVGNFVLSTRHEQHENWATDRLRALLRDGELDDMPVVQFALAAMGFDRAALVADFVESRRALLLLEQLTPRLIATLGERHAYLGLVLLTLAAAKCSQAIAEGALADARRYADVLSLAIQRTSAQLGPDHVHTLGGMANLAHVEFEIALSSGTPEEVALAADALNWLGTHCAQTLGDQHPLSVCVAINAAVAELETARRKQSLELLQNAARQLGEVAVAARNSFGAQHPYAAVARSNAVCAAFDLARAQRTMSGLRGLPGEFESTIEVVRGSLGARHAVAEALVRQLRACRWLLSAGDVTETDSGGGVGTVVRTIADELWQFSDDYLPVHDLPPGGGRLAPNFVDARRDFLAAIDKTIKYFNDGDIVEGTIVKVDRDEVLLDIGYKTEGVIPSRELSIKHDVDPNDVVKVGDEVEALVLQKEDKEGRLILSKKRAQYERAWGTIEALKESDEPVKGTVIEVVKGGLILDIGLRGFLPASLVEMRRVRDLQPYVGRELEAKIIELDKNRNNVVLSRRAWLEQTQPEARSDTPIPGHTHPDEEPDGRAEQRRARRRILAAVGARGVVDNAAAVLQEGGPRERQLISSDATEIFARLKSDAFHELIASSMAGEHDAVATLFTWIRPAIVRYCRSRIRKGAQYYAAADEVAQETCVAVLGALGRYNDEPESFLPFLYGIAAHKVADYYRRTGRDLHDSSADVPDGVHPNATPEQLIMAADLRERLADLLNTLPPRQREVLRLRLIVGLSAQETAETVGLTPTAVRAIQHRSLARIRSALSRAEWM